MSSTEAETLRRMAEATMTLRHMLNGKRSAVTVDIWTRNSNVSSVGGNSSWGRASGARGRKQNFSLIVEFFAPVFPFLRASRLMWKMESNVGYRRHEKVRYTKETQAVTARETRVNPWWRTRGPRQSFPEFRAEILFRMKYYSELHRRLWLLKRFQLRNR